MWVQRLPVARPLLVYCYCCVGVKVLRSLAAITTSARALGGFMPGSQSCLTPDTLKGRVPFGSRVMEKTLRDPVDVSRLSGRCTVRPHT